MSLGAFCLKKSVSCFQDPFIAGNGEFPYSAIVFS